jgi:hypothetical protein
MAQAAWPVVHETRTTAGYDSNGYEVPEGYGAGVDRMVFGWQPETVNVEVDFGYQMRVTNRQEVMVPDIRLYGPNDQLVLGLTLAQIDANTPRLRVDEIRDYSHSPFRGPGEMTPFGPAPGVLVVERVSG